MTGLWRPADPRRSPANDPWPEDLTRAYHRMRAELDAAAEIAIHFDRTDREPTRQKVRGEHEAAMLARMDQDGYAL